MERWKPIRKIIAAAIAALAGEGGALVLYLAGTIDGKAALSMGIAAVLPLVAGYFTGDGASLSGGYRLDPDPGEQADEAV